MFQLSKTPIEKLNVRKGFSHSGAGAFSSFEGWVRDHNNGKKVTALEYEAFEALCNKEAKKILREAQRKFRIIHVSCVHRIGKLKIGEMAVWVGVTAAHRDASFKACRYIIDEIKARLPIWKKEYYINKDSGWVGCDACACHAQHPERRQGASAR